MYIFRYYKKDDQNCYYSFGTSLPNVVSKLVNKFDHLNEENMSVDVILNCHLLNKRHSFKNGDYMYMVEVNTHFNLQYFNQTAYNLQEFISILNNPLVTHVLNEKFPAIVEDGIVYTLDEDGSKFKVETKGIFYSIIEKENFLNEYDIIMNLPEIAFTGLIYKNTKDNKYYKFTDLGYSISGNPSLIFSSLPNSSDFKILTLSKSEFKQFFTIQG